MDEYNLAVSGYWRNWERFVGVPMRENAFIQIAGNPYIKAGGKPRSPADYMKLSIDGERKEAVRPTEDEVKKAQEWAKTLMNGSKK